MIRVLSAGKFASKVGRVLVRFSSYSQAPPPKCLVLHPVSYPNKGPVIQQYLAEEAIGLVSSLKWEVVRGPFWQQDKDEKNVLLTGKLPPNTVYIEPYQGTQIKDGTYVKTSLGNGMLYKDGILFDDEPTETDGDLYSQWQNKSIRESLANSSLVKCKKITQKYYFSKGKLERIIAHVLKTQPSCLFINSELKPGQVRNLKKLLESQLNNKSPPKGYHTGGEEDQSETELDSTQEIEQVQTSRRRKQGFKKIQIFDRFAIILQIFAKRTTSKLAKLQIELSYLSYLKTRLVRDGSTYSSNLNVFSGDLLNSSQISLEIISAKQRRAIGTMSGQGQSQLQMERRNIKNQEARIRRQIQEETKLRQHRKDKQKSRNISMPIIALVGYTNVGKSAFMNYIMGKNEVESKDILFQTLKTTSRHIELPSGTKAILMDTIGFITDLPVELIDSFKVTLEDISHADLVIHLRDISHPQNQLQKQSVVAILKELKFSSHFDTQKMIQVWNKVDLLDSHLALGTEKFGSELKVSCKTGQNMSSLLGLIDEKLRKIRGLTKKRITFGFEHNYKVTEWLRKIANISYNLKFEHNYEVSAQYPSGSVTIEVELDQILYSKLMKYIGQISDRDYEKVKSRSKKGLPPKEGW